MDAGQCSELALAGGPYSGAALNPARVLGPSLVFQCYWDTVPVYVTAELLGAFFAALLTMPLYGFGPHVSAGGRPTADAEVTLPDEKSIVLTAGAPAY